MNSADYKQDTAGSIHGKHKRVNSTLSFTDMPTYFEQENEEFFVLSFDKGSERKDQNKGGSGELKQRKENKENRVLNVLDEEKMNRRIVEKPDREIAKCREANGLRLEKKGSVPDGAKLRKKMQPPGTQNVDPECSSEESSPVSVLDFAQFIDDHDVPASEEDSKATEGLNPRRKLSPELENYGCKSPCNGGNLMEDDDPKENNIKVKKLGSRKNHWQSEKSLEDWNAIEAEVAKSNWLCSKSKDEELEDIAADFGSKMLDQLLDELVIQFSSSYPVYKYSSACKLFQLQNSIVRDVQLASIYFQSFLSILASIPQLNIV
ncbi:hypothetical protein V6N13_145235 [Hibiscus sabdariffa]